MALRARLVALVLAVCVFTGSDALALAPAEQVTKSPNSPTSGELVESPKDWDGKQLKFTGEVITEAMERGDYAWLHINDDAYYLKNVEEGAPLGGYNTGMPVWLPKEGVENIRTYGDYKHEGDVVTVTGTFNAACGEHGGDMDIHATGLEVKIEGRPVNEPVKPVKTLIGLLLTGLAAILWAANRRAESRELKGLFGSG